MYSIAFDQRLSSWLVFSAVPFSLLPRANRQSVIEKKKPTKMNRKRNYSLDSIRYVLPVFFFGFIISARLPAAQLLSGHFPI